MREEHQVILGAAPLVGIQPSPRQALLLGQFATARLTPVRVTASFELPINKPGPDATGGPV